MWGRRLARTISLVPGPVAGVAVPTAFGRVPLGWMGALRLHDEWVHQWDVATAFGRPQPSMDAPLARLLAEFQLRALPAAPLTAVERRAGVVRVTIEAVLDVVPVV